jgi:hypothetical protein
MRLEARAGRVAWKGIAVAVATSSIEAEHRETAALYLLVTGCNVPGAVAGEVVGCSRQNVSQVIRRVEDRRDDPQFDAELARLERLLFGEV